MNGYLPYLMLAPLVVFGAAMLLRHWLRMKVTGSLRRRFVAMRESGRLFIILAFVMPCFYLLLIMLFLDFAGGSLLLRLLRAVPMALMFAAMQTLALARRPAGKHWKCSLCKYDLRGLEGYPTDDAPARHDFKCPECAQQWGWPGGSVRTERVWSPKWVVITAILLLPLLVSFASVPLGGIRWWEQFVLARAPTSSLVEEVLTSRSFTLDAWAELRTRHLPPADNSRIGGHVLGRPAGAYINPDESAWLTAALCGHSIDPGLVTPKLASLFDISGAPGKDPNTVVLTFKPRPADFAPFAGMDVGVWTSRSRPAYAPLHPPTVPQTEKVHTFAVAGMGYTLYSTYSVGPFTASEAQPGKFVGTCTIALIPPSGPRPPGAPPASIPSSPNGLYSIDIPLELPIQGHRDQP